MRPLSDLLQTGDFARRHIGPSPEEQAEMLAELGYSSLDGFIGAVVPKAIARPDEMQVGGPVTEAQAIADLKALASKNKVFRSYIGMGYSGTHTPPVDSSQHLGKSRLVHRLHAVSGRDFAGALGNAAQLSADGDGHDGHGSRQCLAAG